MVYPIIFDEYKKMLSRFLEEDYVFAFFNESSQLLKEDRRFVLMRHDLDFDLDKALVMARIEHQLGVRSTWFVMLRSEHYNPFALRSLRNLREIEDLGHEIGLHFDCEAYDSLDTVESIRSQVSNEIEMLNTIVQKRVNVVSFHRPNEIVISGDPGLTAPFPHTYMSKFVGEIGYFSDSLGTWRFGHPFDSEIWERRQPFHLLIHPVWWTEKENEPMQKLEDSLTYRMKTLEASYAANCKVYRKDNDR